MYMYIFLYEAKRHRAWKHRRPLPKGLKFPGWIHCDNSFPRVKIKWCYLLLFGRSTPPFSCIWSYMKRKVIGFGNIKGPYPGAWNFQGGAKGTIYAPCKNIVMLSCLVWKIRSPHFHVYLLIWSEKTSGSKISKAPTQGPGIFREKSLGQSTPPLKIWWCYLV